MQFGWWPLSGRLLASTLCRLCSRGGRQARRRAVCRKPNLSHWLFNPRETSACRWIEKSARAPRVNGETENLLKTAGAIYRIFRVNLSQFSYGLHRIFGCILEMLKMYGFRTFSTFSLGHAINWEWLHHLPIKFAIVLSWLLHFNGAWTYVT